MKQTLLVSASVAILASAGCTDAGNVPDMEGFLERVESCQAASYTTDRAAGARGTYTVEGPADPGCRLAFTYVENPNPDLVGKSVAFVVDPEGDVERQLKAGLTECLEGRGGDFRCEGPLFTAAGGTPDGLAGGDGGPLPCGEAVADSGEALFPLPRDGAWGYVDRAGNWVIEPAWDRAGDFHEGRAIVARGGAWGVIDRQGNEVLKPGLGSQSFSRVDGKRIGVSPLKPFSEGCAAGVGSTAGRPPFFVDRDGHIHWRQGTPDSLAGLDLREFGSFSGGLAWFRVPGEIRSRYGWLDAEGKIVVEPKYQHAGQFVDGIAPASPKSGQAGFLDRAGELVLPRKWTLDTAGSFSEGWAYVGLGSFDSAYMNRDGDFMKTVTFSGGDTAEVGGGGQFHGGLAPVRILKKGEGLVLHYIDTRGRVVMTPSETSGIKVCNPNPPPEFHNGLLRLLVANDGEDCGDANGLGLAGYQSAHYRYFNRDMETVLSSAGQ